MASQQPPRPLFRFASMVRPAPAAQPPAPPAPAPAPAPQPLYRPAAATPFRPPATTTATAQPTQPQEPRPQTQPAAASPVATVAPPAPATPQPRPQPAVPTPRSPFSAPQPQSAAAASPRPTPKSPAAPSPPVVSPPKVPPPRSPESQRAAPDVPKSPVTKVTPLVPQSPFKKTSEVTKESAPITPYSSLPPSPKTKMVESASMTPYSSLPPSPKTKAAESLNQSSPPKTPSPSQKVISQTKSPQIKPAVSHPLSPLKLPPSQLEFESKNPPQQIDQKTVVVQETMRANNNGHQSSRNVGNGKRQVKKDEQKKMSNSESGEEHGMSVLTLAGENKGAIMELSPSRNKHSPASPKAWSSEESEKANKRKANKSLPMTAFMNSNVQAVNNSILHNASCTHHDPGVHLVFSRKPHGLHVKGSPN